MSLLNYIKQIWDTTSYFNPTRMNHIEDGIYAVSDKVDNLSADDIAYDSNNSVKDKIDDLTSEISNATNSVIIRRVCNMAYLYIDRSTLQFNADGKVVNYTIPEGYRPKYLSVYLTKVYNGTSYVDCEVDVTTDGTIRITDLFGNAINGIQVQFIKQFVFTYYL